MNEGRQAKIPEGRPLRIVFMGTPDFAVPTLEALLQGPHKVVSVYTQPDKPQGRGQKLSPPPVKVIAQEAGIPVFQPEKMTSPEALARFQADQPDLAVVVAYGKILRKRILEVPPLGCINCHASLLPFYRGAAPIYWVLAKGETETGITTMWMDEGMDTGPMLLRRAIPIGAEETGGTLHDRLAACSAELLVETLGALLAGKLQPQAQEHEKATYAPMLKKEDSFLYFDQAASRLHDHIRALDPFPGGRCLLPDGTGCKLFGSQFLAKEAGLPGEVLSASEQGLVIAGTEGAVLIKEIQKEGRKRMAIRDFLRGSSLAIGSRFRSGLEGFTASEGDG